MRHLLSTWRAGTILYLLLSDRRWARVHTAAKAMCPLTISLHLETRLVRSIAQIQRVAVILPSLQANLSGRKQAPYKINAILVVCALQSFYTYADMILRDHTDKHKRPHRCKHSDCEKIPGFTYSGGLLRHQREVHNLHGGPKTLWMCPYKGCKRSVGPGFSRKDNLHVHLRRVHMVDAKTEAAPEHSGGIRGL